MTGHHSTWPATWLQRPAGEESKLLHFVRFQEKSLWKSPDLTPPPSSQSDPKPESPGLTLLALLVYLGESESEVAQSCPTLSDPVDCSLPDFSVHGILQAGILEWVAISFSNA